MSFDPRKQRTRQHIIADLSVHYVEGFILEEGHTARRLDSDYSYDLVMRTFDESGYVEPGPIYFQLKASESLQTVGAAFFFDMDIRDYNLWMQEEMPVVFVLFDAEKRKAYWVCVQHYFDENTGNRPRKGAKSVRIRVSKSQSMSRLAVKKMRDLKSSI